MEIDNKPSCCAASRTPSDKRDRDIIIEKKLSSISKDNMIKLPGGNFLMGTNDEEGFPADGEGPVREITLNSFYIDITTVTNLQFSEFIKATKYITDAGRYGWSFVFYALLSEEDQKAGYEVAATTPWWCAVPGAQCDHPEGGKTNINERMDHPVVHVSWNDALTYCQWIGKRLPTEAEWEFAARGGLQNDIYPWGNEPINEGKPKANSWGGKFPYYNDDKDGFVGLAPIKSFMPNGYGLYDMAGNVWEWCSDWYDANYYQSFGNSVSLNPKGPAKSNDPMDPYTPKRSLRGGSFLCNDSYCSGYRVARRMKSSPDTGLEHTGFRCVRDGK